MTHDTPRGGETVSRLVAHLSDLGIQLALLDLDGTLLKIAHHFVILEAMAIWPYCRGQISLEVAEQAYQTGPRKDYYELLWDNLGQRFLLPGESEARARRSFQRAFETAVTLFERRRFFYRDLVSELSGARLFLRELVKRKIRPVIVTMTPVRLALLGLRAAGLMKFVHAVHGSEEFARNGLNLPKSDPRLWRSVAHRYHFRMHQCVGAEDGQLGVTGLIQARCRALVALSAQVVIPRSNAVVYRSRVDGDWQTLRLE